MFLLYGWPLPQEEGRLHVLHPDVMVIGVVEDVREELYSTARSSLLDSFFFDWIAPLCIVV